MTKNFIHIIILLTCIGTAWAGNPDRQGEAGAYELLLNPYARSAGLHSINTANVSGVESMRINVAGLGDIENTEFVFGSALYYEGTGVSLNALGFSRKVGKAGAIGVSVMAVNFGEIDITTEDQPAGTGGTFSPTFLNIGLGYSRTFENKISVGILIRAISQSISDAQAFGMCLDFGIQYVTGRDDNFKLGISLRNIGGKMEFAGQGLNREVSPNGFPINFRPTAKGFDLPSMLNIGISNDFDLTQDQTLTVLANFTSNSFSEDNFSAGLEYSLFDQLRLRAAYRYSSSQFSTDDQSPVYSGLAGGFGYSLKFGDSKNKALTIDYAYRATNRFNGTHNLSLRLNL